MLAKFTIAVELDVPRSVQVIVYSNVKDLRAAAARHSNRWMRERKRGDYAEVLGVCHRFEIFDKEGELLSLCAIVRLAEPNLGIGIVSHELAHAALWIHELRKDVPESLTCANDEPFAWVLGELVRQTVNMLNVHKIYD